MRAKIALIPILALVVSAGWSNGVNVAAVMAEHARAFLGSLHFESQRLANLAFDDENRYDWHYIPRS